MDWPSTNKGRGESVCATGGRPRRVRRYSEVRRHATLSPLCTPLPSHPFSHRSVPLYALARALRLYRFRWNLPTARTHTFRG